MAYCIEAQRVNLRTAGKADTDSIYRYARDREIGRWTLLPRPYRRKHALAFVRASKICARKKKPHEILLGIEHKAMGEIIGGIGLHNINYLHKNAEIGCWIGVPFQRQGLVTEAMQAALKYAFTTLKLKRVYAQVFAGNIASQKLVKRCGFTQEGCLRASFFQHNRWRTSYLYSMLREEFKDS